MIKVLIAGRGNFFLQKTGRGVVWVEKHCSSVFFIWREIGSIGRGSSFAFNNTFFSNLDFSSFLVKTSFSILIFCFINRSNRST